MFKRMMKPLAFGFLLALTLTRGISAQTEGGVSGRIADSTGASMPGVEVTLTETATSGVRKTVTTQAGDYTFPEVPPGTYTLLAKHAGFKEAQSDTFEVQVDQSVRQNFTLQVGDVTQTIEVSTTGALLQAENPTLGTVVESAEVTELPLQNRNFLGLVALSSN